MSEINNSVGNRDLSKTAKCVTKDMLEKAIKDTEHATTANVTDFTVEWATQLGDNSATFVLRVKVKAQIDGTEEDRSFILKTNQDNEEMNAFLRKIGLFRKEIGTYTEVLPAYIQVQKDRGVEPIPLSVPKFYHGVVDDVDVPGIVMVEDLKPHGYKMVDKSQGADLAHAMLAVKELAKWHALSVALKNGDVGHLKERFDFVFKETAFGTAAREMHGPFLEACLQSMVKLVQESKLSTDEIKSRIVKLLDCKSFDTIRSAIQPEEPFALICHGDFWCNNMLFKYQTIDGVETPVDVKLLDLQATRYALPTTDLAYFLMLNTSRKLRKAHLRDLLQHYHSTFMSVLQHVNFDFPEFTLEVLEGLFRKTAILGILFGAMAVPFFKADKKDFENFEKIRSEATDLKTMAEKFGDAKEEVFGSNDQVEEHFIGFAEEAIELGII